jgi:hypothetical protein
LCRRWCLWHSRIGGEIGRKGRTVEGGVIMTIDFKPAIGPQGRLKEVMGCGRLNISAAKRKGYEQY